MGKGSHTPEWIGKAVSIIEADVRKHFTIREISLAVGTNSYSLKQGFKQAYGMGPYEYLLEARLKKAIELLIHTNHPIKTICHEVGYRSPSSFIVVFKKKYGVPPLVWKRNKTHKKN